MRQQKGMLTWRLSWEIIMGKFLKILSNGKKSFSKRIIFEEWLLHTDMTAFFGRTLVDFAW